MDQVFVQRFNERKDALRSELANGHPGSYGDLVKLLISNITGDEYGYEDNPDPERIHEIDDGDYQGTLVFVIAAKGYQPSGYWFVKVFYGSCSGCDTLRSIKGYDSDPPSDEQIGEYMTLLLHLVQGLKKME